MIMNARIVTFFLLCFTLTEAKIYNTRFPRTTWDDYNWRLSSGLIQQGLYQGRANVANGYTGINVASLGPFFEVEKPVNGDDINGWPLFQRRQTFATVAGFWNEQPRTEGSNFPWLYQYGGESVISGIPHWSGLIPSCNGYVLDANTNLAYIKDYSSTYDFKTGTLSWAYTWTPPGCPAFDISYEMFANKLHVNQAAVKLKITPSKSFDIQVYDVLNGDCATRSNFVEKGFDPKTATIFSAVTPSSLHKISAYVYSTLTGDSTADFSTLKSHNKGKVEGYNASSIAQSVTLNLQASRTSRIMKFIGVASSDAIADPKAAAWKASLEGAKTGYFAMLRQHSAEWAKILTPDSVDAFQNPSTGDLPNDQNIVEQSILAVVNPYYLLQNTVSENAIKAAKNPNLNKYSIAVGGLSSDSYAGLIFWDSDVWMQPGLVLSHPYAAKQITEYRLGRREQAIANIKTAYQSSQNHTKFSPNAAIYSWTSARYGNCTATGPCFDYEYHLNGDIALGVENYYLATGDASYFKSKYFPIFTSAAQVFSNLLYYNKTTGSYWLRNGTDPDEFANFVNNPGYTMILAQTIMQRAIGYQKKFGFTQNSEWAQQAKNIEIPLNKTAGLHLEFTGMPGDIEVKQADVVLIYDFLHYHSPYLRNDFDFYAGRQSQSGPALTYSVFSIISSRYVLAGCGQYTYDLYGSQPYLRGPWFQFSEQLLDDYQKNGGFHPAFPFLSGHGGANRVAPFGYLGLQLEENSFNIQPILPPQIPFLRLRTIYWQGYAISATLNQTHTTIKRLNHALPIANPAYAGAAIPVTIGQEPKIYKLSAGQTLTFTNRRPNLHLTVPGNVAQCKTVTYDQAQAYQPGQFPLSAVDGAISTKWQPSKADVPAWITVELGSRGLVPIAGFEFDWAQAVPLFYSISFANVSSPAPSQMRNVTSSSNVKVSKPYDAKTAKVVQRYMSNTTSVKLPKPVFGGRYATLTIKGSHANQGSTGVGATVAEWAIVAGAGRTLAARYVSPGLADV